MSNLLRIMLPILKLLLYTMLLIMVLTWPATQQYPINIVSILGIWNKNFLILLLYADIMGGHICTREVYDPLCLRSFPEENLILTHYMLSALWLNLLDGLGHYVILPGAIGQVLATTNNIMTLGYTYAKQRLKKPPENFLKFWHIGRIIAWIPSRLAWNTSLRGRDRSLLRPSLPT